MGLLADKRTSSLFLSSFRKKIVDKALPHERSMVELITFDFRGV